MSRIRSGSVRYGIGIIVLVVAYIVTGVAGIKLAAGQLVTAVWPPSGLAVIALVIGGRRFWPGIFLGAVIAERVAGVPLLSACGIAVGSTLAPIGVATALKRFDVDHDLSRVRDVLVFFCSAAVGTMVSATVGTLVLVAGGRPLTGAGVVWLTWWIGDAMGVVLIAPVALTMWRSKLKPLPRFETAGFIAITAVAAFVLWREPLPIRHLMVWLAILAALRLGPRGAAAVALVASAVAIGTASWTPGPDNFVLLQTLNASIALTALTLGAVMHERDEVTTDLRDLAGALEERVARRTAALAEANAHLRKLDETKNAILSAVSHELRTPLTAILGFTELLGEPDVRADDHMTDELLEKLDGSSRRLSRLLQDLLDLGRLEHGVVEPQREAHAIGELVREAIADVDVSKHYLTVDANGDSCTVDPTHFERIVHNLVSNAVKYTPHGTAIHLEATADGKNGVDIVVTDEGPGIPDSMRAAIFEPFRRIEGGAHAQGAGVGLALVDRFAKMHGGSAWVIDREGGGCAFHVRLPGPGAERTVSRPVSAA